MPLQGLASSVYPLVHYLLSLRSAPGQLLSTNQPRYPTIIAMAEQPPDYKKLFLEEQRRREAAEEAQKEEQRKREQVEERIRKTTLPEFLDACHNYLHSGLTIQTDATLSTRGDPANANNKLRPERICEWEDFPARQEAIWNNLMKSAFVSEQFFTSVHTLQESGDAVRQRMLSSELDLHLFQRSTVEDPVSLIVKQLYNSRALRRKFGLHGSISFENHANTLTPDLLVNSLEQISVSSNRRRRSPRLLAKELPGPSEPSVAAQRSETARSSRPRADQFCVYNTSTQNQENRIPAFIMEYKAPHKLPLSYICEGLEDMELAEVIRCGEVDAPKDRFRRLVAAVITQAFSYMVRIGVEFGCVCTGEAFVFLRVPDDPRTVYYFLSVPKGDVGATTGWTPDLDSVNRLHLTAVGQMLAFTLQALKTPQRGQQWRVQAANQLITWEVVYEDLLDTILPEDVASSEYQPPRHSYFLRMSPVRLRRRPGQTSSPSCEQPQDPSSPSDEDPDPDTPSQRRRPLQAQPLAPTTARSSSDRHAPQAAQDGQYCTQNCLRGLVEGGPLDMQCPNIDQTDFLARIRQQLSSDLDTNCQPVSLPGACGVLFRCTPIDFVHRLEREATVYELLRPVQGIHVPGICELVHMMFLSFGGRLISKHLTSENIADVTKNLMPRNMLWSVETVVKQRTRKQETSKFARERQRMATEIRSLALG
ncbi:uncharacterized protein BDR25DRAFT_338082 [Lindgomyces ingoldianus]|uniref:Uncharacterized protein n=1 Tax=Lindgomyces ingoldianus TaxID=673940 RepID=A0ACB6Q7U0_9PLEO|nr:uncharacterized protein BDR25DRAFT_338082 [Lindgomyces ingoldianus]KAF2462948.1 hypothetical protein BDR25DRAFT_338082 [Lindgomyces ingoldianus]